MEEDLEKYQTARKLHKYLDEIRAQYREDWNNENPLIRQRAVALYFIDKLALRAGNEKDEDTADTVGCCTIRVEHVTLHEKLDDKKYVVKFDFLGKDSIPFRKKISVDKQVFENLESFKENKKSKDQLFDLLKPSALNKHLESFMDGLTAKVFRTYNACCTFQEQLKLLTKEDDTIADKMSAYQEANKAVAILLNHQHTVKGQDEPEISLETSKLNYLDPRITVAWCEKFGVPIEEMYTEAQREKFAWAIETEDKKFEF